MNIGLVSPYSWDVPGGVNRHIEQLAAHLRRRGHRVTVIAPDGRAQEGFYTAGRSFAVSANRSVAHISFGPRVASRVRRFLAASSFDVLHLHEPLIPSVSMLALLYSRCANVATFHAAREEGSMGYRLALPLLRRLAARIHLRAAVSPAAEELVSRYFPGPYRILPNGVDTELFSPRGPGLPGLRGGVSQEGATRDGETAGRPMSTREGTRDGAIPEGDRFNLIFVGRAEPRKGLEVLLRALTVIRAARPQVRLLVVGAEGRGRGEEGVVWLGRLEDGEMPAAYRSAEVMVAPALGGESFGIVLLEAMACGLPVVASDIPGYRHVLQDGVQGLLVPPGDPGALAEAVLRLVDDGEERSRMATAALERAECFSWKKLVEEVEEAYREAVELKRTGR